MGLSRQVRRAQERAQSKGRDIYREPKAKPIEMTEEEADALLTSAAGRYPKHGVDNDLPFTKGQVFGGVCNRTACDNTGATWWNRGTYALYCKDCAMAINEPHGLSPRLPLCVPVLAKPSFQEMDILARPA